MQLLLSGCSSQFVKNVEIRRPWAHGEGGYDGVRVNVSNPTMGERLRVNVSYGHTMGPGPPDWH